MCLNTRQSKLNTADGRITHRHRWELCSAQRPAEEDGLEVKQGNKVERYRLPPGKAQKDTDQVLKLYHEDKFALGIKHFDPNSP